MINLENLGVFLPQGFLFKDVHLQINDGDKIGLVGKNGAGKSTLLKLIAGWETPSEGKIHRGKDTSIGFLTQDIVIDTNKSVFDYLNYSNEQLNKLRNQIEDINHQLTTRTDYESESYLSLLDDLTVANEQFQLFDGYQWEEKITGALLGLGFKETEFTKPLNEFSGGWKMRAELAKILVNNPSVILLDEPTNHLDIISISWLEEYLQKFTGSVITISHDRLFLDNVTKRTLEITNAKILDFPYPYTLYKAKREEELERLTEAKKQQDKDIKRQEELINKFRAKANKSAFAQSLIKKLDKTERIEVESNAVARMKVKFPLSVQPGKWVLELDNLGKAYGDNLLFKEVNLTVGRGEKIALLGPNGVGKSTLLKRIMRTLDGSGEVNYGHNVEVTYFAQNQAEQLDPNKTVFETVDDTAIGEIRKDLRSILGAFLFGGEDVEKKVSVLSGGERTRLALCQLLLSPSNVLILDEPTNHLDMQSKEVLKQALKNYEGTFIVVSHDREFLDGLTNRIWDIENQQLKIHHFTVKEYLVRKSDAFTKKQVNKENPKQKPIAQNDRNDINFQEQKELKRRHHKLKNDVIKAEDKITRLEKEMKSLDEIIASMDYSDEKTAQSQLESYKLLQNELDQVMLDWEQMNDELIEIEKKVS
jgi:ATP-binding cassette subfamily F protein 3